MLLLQSCNHPGHRTGFAVASALPAGVVVPVMGSRGMRRPYLRSESNTGYNGSARLYNPTTSSTAKSSCEDNHGEASPCPDGVAPIGCCGGCHRSLDYLAKELRHSGWVNCHSARGSAEMRDIRRGEQQDMHQSNEQADQAFNWRHPVQVGSSPDRER